MPGRDKYRIGILSTHPIQYYTPWYKALAACPEIDPKVFYCHRQTPEGQAEAGFGTPFNWDTALLEGYEYQFLENRAPRPDVNTFFGCDTPRIGQLIREERFDAFIVHGWQAKSFWQAIKTCWVVKTPVFIRGDSYLLTNYLPVKRWVKKILYPRFIPRFDAYLLVGERAKEYYLHYGADEKRMFFVPHAVDNEFFASRCVAFKFERESIRKRWGIPGDSFVFLYAGKLIPKKRVHDFIKALKASHGRCPKIFGLIAGDGPLRAELEKIAQKHSIAVAFTGFLNQKELPGAYAAADVLVLPSDIGETWGLVVNEAMASGLPAIVSDKVGCAPDLVHPRKTGDVYRCGDIKRLSEVIIEFTLKPEMVKYMSENAKRVIDRHSVNAAVMGTLKALNFVIRNKK